MGEQTGQADLLTAREHNIIERAGALWDDLCGVVEDGPTRGADLAELIVHVHAIQRAVMANAAARAYPMLYRRLGSRIE